MHKTILFLLAFMFCTPCFAMEADSPPVQSMSAAIHIAAEGKVGDAQENQESGCNPFRWCFYEGTDARSARIMREAKEDVEKEIAQAQKDAVAIFALAEGSWATTSTRNAEARKRKEDWRIFGITWKDYEYNTPEDIKQDLIKIKDSEIQKKISCRLSEKAKCCSEGSCAFRYYGKYALEAMTLTRNACCCGPFCCTCYAEFWCCPLLVCFNLCIQPCIDCCCGECCMNWDNDLANARGPQNIYIQPQPARREISWYAQYKATLAAREIQRVNLGLRPPNNAYLNSLR